MEASANARRKKEIEMKSYRKTMSDGASLAVYEWLPEKQPTGVLHIVHGMAEHALRYDAFAQKACNNGFAVIASDHRGHGKTAQDAAAIGYLADRDGFARVVDDQHEINADLKSRYPSLPLVIVGHSFGSFVTQEYLERYGATVDAAVLIGTSGPNPSVRLAALLASLTCLVKGRKAPAKLMNALVFGAYTRAVPNAKTEFDWLSRDAAEVQKYIADDRCGFLCTAGFYQDFMRGLLRIHRKKALQGIPITTPILITAGSCDPVSNGSKTLKGLFRLYQRRGIQDVTVKIYEQARHEILNEINKEEVTADILHWISERVLHRE